MNLPGMEKYQPNISLGRPLIILIVFHFCCQNVWGKYRLQLPPTQASRDTLPASGVVAAASFNLVVVCLVLRGQSGSSALSLFGSLNCAQSAQRLLVWWAPTCCLLPNVPCLSCKFYLIFSNHHTSKACFIVAFLTNIHSCTLSITIS